MTGLRCSTGSETADYVQNGTGEIASLFPAEGGEFA